MATLTRAPAKVQAGQPNARPVLSIIGTILRYALLIFFALIFVSPFVLSFLGTFKAEREITAWPPSILPEQWLWQNWVEAWNVRVPRVEGNAFSRWLLNSLFLALVNTTTQTFLSALVGYGFARIRFPGRELIFTFMLATMALPGFVTLVPAYVFFARLGWINTYWPLIVPGLVVAGSIFVMTQFFKSLPRELEEAAYIDGASRFTTFLRVGLPLARAPLITVAILQFQASWNNFLGPLLYLRSPDMMTLTVGLSYFKSQFRTDWSSLLVGAMFNAIPILIIFFFFNRYFVNTGSTSGLAGQ